MNVHEIEQELLNLETSRMQSISELMDLGKKVASWMAYTGGEMARAKKAYLQSKKQAYKDALDKLRSEGKEVAPSLVKDYVGTLVSDQEEYYLLCDRINAACTHYLTHINVCLSCLKEELKAITYGNAT